MKPFRYKLKKNQKIINNILFQFKNNKSIYTNNKWIILASTLPSIILFYL